MDVEPYKSLKIPLFDIRNIQLRHAAYRPRGKIHVVRETSHVEEKSSFVKTARISSTYVLKLASLQHPEKLHLNYQRTSTKGYL